MKAKQKLATVKSQGQDQFDHYVAVDWSQKIMAIARCGYGDREPSVFERKADIGDLKAYLKSLPGRIIMTIEESTATHWLYVELYDWIDRLLICDPYRNHLLSDGSKTDKADARKLCILLKSGLLKEVYHTTHHLYHLRKLVSGYEDVIRAGVRAKNQWQALLRSYGGTHTAFHAAAEFVRKPLAQSIELYETHRQYYQDRFRQLGKKHRHLKNLTTIPGIGIVHAVKILGIVVDASRFPNAKHYLSYCGLIRHTMQSGGRSYGNRRGRYCAVLKAVYKSAALTAIHTDSWIRDYYERLLKDSLPEYYARHAVARYLARLSYGVIKNGKPFKPLEPKK